MRKLVLAIALGAIVLGSEGCVIIAPLAVAGVGKALLSPEQIEAGRKSLAEFYRTNANAPAKETLSQ